MDYGYQIHAKWQPDARMRRQIAPFLEANGLAYDADADYSAIVTDGDGSVCATGSLHGNVLKCIAVRPESRGEDLMATVATDLLQAAVSRGRRQLFVYTKPQNRPLFESVGFHVIARTADAMLLERPKGGVADYFRRVKSGGASGLIGAIVANCNPVTNGHLYLIEQARAQCDFLYVFIVSEDRSAVPFSDRIALVREACKNMDRMAVCPTGQYQISDLTFPLYFIKDGAQRADVGCALDIALFTEQYAKELGIRRRFVGTEPVCRVTAAYHAALLCALPPQGIELIEIPRLEQAGGPVSASTARALAAAGEWERLQQIVPDATFRYCRAHADAFAPRAGTAG